MPSFPAAPPGSRRTDPHPASRSVLSLILLLGMLVVAASYVLNFGWFRLIFAVVAIPYFIALATLNLFFIRNVPDSWLKTALFGASLLTCIGWNLSWIDGGDVPPLYCCFGLIRGEGGQFTRFGLTEGSLMLLFASLLGIHAVLALSQAGMLLATWIRGRRNHDAQGKPSPLSTEER